MQRREKGAPLMQNDVWRASCAAAGWMRSAGSRRRRSTKEKNLCQLTKKERKKSGQNFCRLPADTKGNIALINSLAVQTRLIPIENANYMVIIFALLSKSLISTSSRGVICLVRDF